MFNGKLSFYFISGWFSMKPYSYFLQNALGSDLSLAYSVCDGLQVDLLAYVFCALILIIKWKKIGNKWHLKLLLTFFSIFITCIDGQ